MNNFPTNLRIKCIGFSVTGYGKPAYHEVLETKFNENGYSVQVSHHALGGLSIDALSYMMSHFVAKGDADLVILEVATSWFSLRRKKEHAVFYLSLILQYLKDIKVNVMFLNLFRKNIEDEDIIVSSISELCMDSNDMLDLKKYFREDLINYGNDSTVDGVHPTPDAIQIIGEKLFRHIILKYNFKDQYKKINLDEDNIHSYFPLEILEKKKKDNPFIFKNRHGINVECEKLFQNQSIEYLFEEKKVITGIYFLIGPDTNYCEMFINNININLVMADSMGYYRRIAFKSIGFLETNRVLITHPAKNISVKFKKESLEKFSESCNYIIGLSSLAKKKCF